MATKLLPAPAFEFPSQLKVLVIEDEPTVAQVIVLLLRAKSLAVTSVLTGLEGLKCLEKEPWDLVVSDVHLPDMRGTRICQLVRQTPRLKGIPVILMSGWVLESEAQEEAGQTAADFLNKPFDVSVFYTKILTQLKRRFETAAASPMQAARNEIIFAG